VPAPSILSPSDLDALPPRSPQRDRAIRVGGRVVASDGLDVTLADAFAEVEVALDAASDVEEGDLAIVDGVRREGKLITARVVDRVRPARPPAQPEGREPASETARFTHLGIGQALVARAVAIGAIRRFFGERRFLEVETPLAVPSPGLDLHLDAFEVRGDEATRYLVTSPEYQMKRLVAGGVPRCFQLARCFRQGEIGHRHNPEFTMLEWYRAFAGVDDVMADTEELVRAVVREVAGTTSIEVGDRAVDLGGPFERLSVGAAFERYAKIPADEAIALATRDEERFFRVLVDDVEPGLAAAPRPVFLLDYPAPLASLARLREGDPRVAERFELYVGGIELCNGFGELTDAAEQRARLARDQEARRAARKPVYPIDERFLAALEEGLPPCAGNALGVDRLIMVAIGADAIGTVQAFPASWV
jgi:lysyl-tRNA synthetase class 2